MSNGKLFRSNANNGSWQCSAILIKTLFLTTLASLSICTLPSCGTTKNVSEIKQDIKRDRQAQINALVSHAERGDFESASRIYKTLGVYGVPANEKDALLERYPELRYTHENLDRFRERAEAVASNSSSAEEYMNAIGDELVMFARYASPKIANKAREVASATYPVRIPLDDLKIGLPLNEFLKIIPKAPVRKASVSFSEAALISVQIFEYSFLPPKEFQSQDRVPFWIAFIDDRLSALGTGGIREAEFDLHQSYLQQMTAGRKISITSALRSGYTKYQELYGKPDSITHEYITYSIMVAEKTENKLITQSEADYLIAQKQAEIDARIAATQREQEELDAAKKQQSAIEMMHREHMAELRQSRESAEYMAQSQMALQRAMGYMQASQMRRINQTLTQMKMRESLANTFTIRPVGFGAYRVTNW